MIIRDAIINIASPAGNLEEEGEKYYLTTHANNGIITERHKDAQD